MEVQKGELVQDVALKDIVQDKAQNELKDAALLLFVNYAKIKNKPLLKAHHL